MIQYTAEKYDADAAVEPQHSQCHRVQGIVNSGQTGKVDDIDGIQLGKYQPAHCSQHRTGEGVEELDFLIGKHQIHGGKQTDFQHKGQ